MTDDGGAAAGGLTRRRLLLGLGAVGGGGAVLGAMAALDLTTAARPAPFSPPTASDLTLQGRERAGSVVVLGAGVAGLCCAYELEKAGYDVTVLEARDRVGGRSLTVRGGTTVEDTRGTVQTATFRQGRFLDAGPARIAQHHLTLDYCRELGVPVEVFVNENPDAFVESGGVVRRRRSVQADLDGYVSELLTKAVDARALDAELTAPEREALVAYLADAGVLGSSRRGYDEPPGTDGGEGQVGEPDDLATLLGLGTGPRLAFERDWDMAMPMFHVVGGMDGLVGALAAALRRPVRTGVTVAAVEAVADGVRVTGTDVAGAPVQVDAAQGICTLPPQLAAVLPNPWAPDVALALGMPRAFPTGKIGLEYDRRFWELDDGILGGISTTSREPRVVWYPSDGILGELRGAGRGVPVRPGRAAVRPAAARGQGGAGAGGRGRAARTGVPGAAAVLGLGGLVEPALQQRGLVHLGALHLVLRPAAGPGRPLVVRGGLAEPVQRLAARGPAVGAPSRRRGAPAGAVDLTAAGTGCSGRRVLPEPLSCCRGCSSRLPHASLGSACTPLPAPEGHLWTAMCPTFPTCPARTTGRRPRVPRRTGRPVRPPWRGSSVPQSWTWAPWPGWWRTWTSWSPAASATSGSSSTGSASATWSGSRRC